MHWILYTVGTRIPSLAGTEPVTISRTAYNEKCDFFNRHQRSKFSKNKIWRKKPERTTQQTLAFFSLISFETL